jgi:hypothetical protein
MAADVQIRRWTGSSGSPTKTNITSINTRANAEDSHSTAGTTNPIQIPSAGTNYSYWVSTRLFANTAPSGVIDNIRWHTDGTANFGTGVDANVGQASSYVQATGSAGSTGNQLTTVAHTGLTGAPVDAFTNYPAAGTALAVTGSINAATGDFGNFVVYQLTVGTSAGPGATAMETFTWLYDET